MLRKRPRLGKASFRVANRNGVAGIKDLEGQGSVEDVTAAADAANRLAVRKVVAATGHSCHSDAEGPAASQAPAVSPAVGSHRPHQDVVETFPTILTNRFDGRGARLVCHAAITTSPPAHETLVERSASALMYRHHTHGW
jgi:hypothetical protein